MRRVRQAGLLTGAVLSLSAVLGLSGCGQGSAHTFCSQVEANGGSGASFGPIPTFYRRTQLLADVDDKLHTMGDIVPPTEIAEPWARQKSALLDVKAAAEQLYNGESLRGVPPHPELDQAQDTLTKYWFAHCR